MVDCSKKSPGSRILTITSPIETAITVVARYIPMVLNPILDNLEISFKSVTPLIKDAKIKGTAITFNALMKILPKGLIQSIANDLPKGNWINTMATKTPIAIPSKIFQCNANFFIQSVIDANILQILIHSST